MDATAVLIYAVFALGAVGVYLALPRSPRGAPMAGLIAGAAAVVGLLVLCGSRLAPGGEHQGYFYVFAAVAILGAGRVITHERPVYSVLYFVLVVLAVAFLLVLQAAEFLAVALVIVYAGAILVTYVFVIMLAQQAGAAEYDRRAREPLLAVVAGFAMMAAVAGRIGELSPTSVAASRVTQQATLTSGGAASTDDATAAAGNTMAVGQVMLARYAIVLEVAGVLLLAALVGAIAIVKKPLPPGEVSAPQRPLGEVGRLAKPF